VKLPVVQEAARIENISLSDSLTLHGDIRLQCHYIMLRISVSLNLKFVSKIHHFARILEGVSSFLS
jgi:hypothetical protein